MPRALFDPFIDRTEGTPAPTAPMLPAGVIPQPNIGAYQSAAAQTVHGGLHVSQVIPQSPLGGYGTLIPKATEDGVPQGSDIHNTKNVAIIVDPHITGQSSVVVLGNVTSERLKRAAARADAELGPPQDLAHRRHYGSVVLQDAGEDTTPATVKTNPDPGVISVQPMIAPFQHVLQPGQGWQQPPANPQVQQRSPMQILRGVPAAQPAQPAQSGPAVYGGAIPDPQIEVRFDRDGFGEFTAFYHDIQRQPKFLVLTYAPGYRGPRYMPELKEGEPVPQLGMQITGQAEVYLVRPTGFRYANQGAEHCVLEILQTVTVPG